MAVLDPLTVDWQPEQIAVMQRLHDWALASAQLNLHIAAFMGLPGSDANALGRIVWAAEDGRPLSPAELSRQIGMSSGATTVLLNRLEVGGHIRRSREHDDRRRVTLRPEPAARARTQEFLAAAGTEVAEAVLATDPDDLRTVAAFVARMHAAVEQANERLAGRPASA